MPFYKQDPDNDQSLFIANLGVDAPDYALRIEEKDNYQYPFNDWYYFDADEDAYNYFGIQIYVPDLNTQ